MSTDNFRYNVIQVTLLAILLILMVVLFMTMYDDDARDEEQRCKELIVAYPDRTFVFTEGKCKTWINGSLLDVNALNVYLPRSRINWEMK